MTPNEIVDRLLEPQREVTIRVGDERSAIGLYNRVQQAVKERGLTKALRNLSVRLGPETAIISWGD